LQTESGDNEVLSSLINFLGETGIAKLIAQMSESAAAGNWLQLVGTPLMLVIACVLLYLAIVKKYEPLLLLPIAFGMLLTNLPMDFAQKLMHPDFFVNEEYLIDGHLNIQLICAEGGLLDLLYLGVKLGIYPPLIFLGIGVMTDFGPLIANPKSLLLGAAAQFGVFAAFIMALVLGAMGLGFGVNEAASIGIIGGADGPTAIFVTKTLAPKLLPAIAVAAYSYMALIPVIQPPFMKLLTTKKSRSIKMAQLRPVSKT
jgi:oxaloacetate decarboxylase beta subunit